jgi:hypothetical protein
MEKKWILVTAQSNMLHSAFWRNLSGLLALFHTVSGTLSGPDFETVPTRWLEGLQRPVRVFALYWSPIQIDIVWNGCGMKSSSDSLGREHSMFYVGDTHHSCMPVRLAPTSVYHFQTWALQAHGLCFLDLSLPRSASSRGFIDVEFDSSETGQV